MTVTPITSRSTEPAQPIKAIQITRELEWNDPHPLDRECLFVDHRSEIKATINVGAGGHEYLSVRIALPDGEHFQLAFTGTAQLWLADAIESAHAKWHRVDDDAKSEAV